MGIARLLSNQEATDLIRFCLTDGTVIPGSHFRQELANEGLDILDAMYVLKSGAIYSSPEQDIRAGNWKYRMEGFETGGKWLAIIFCFKSVDTGFLITVFSIASKSR